MADSWYEVAFGAHYPDLYGHRNDAEALRCLELLPRLGPLRNQGLPVLDLGCGDGRHLAYLKKMKLDAIGLDLSSPLLALADARPEKIPLIRGDMRALPFKEQALASVLSLFTAFGYFGKIEENEIVMQEVSRVLCTGGHWFLDYFNCDRVREELGSGEKFSRQRIKGGMRIEETRQYSEPMGIVSKEVFLKPIPETDSSSSIPTSGLRYMEKVAVFKLNQIDDLARKNGLVRVSSAGSYDGASLDEGDRWILVYRKESGKK